MEITKKKLFILSQFVFIQLSGAMEPNYDRQLIGAVEGGNLDLAKQALDNGANPNTFRDGWTVLALAAHFGYLELVNLLIARGANIDLGSLNPMILAEGDVKVVKVLLASGIHVDAVGGDNVTAIAKASHLGRAKVVKLLLAAGAEVNYQDDFGDTALMRASLNGETELVKLLLNAGADLNLKNIYEGTAFSAADYRAAFGNEKVRDLLHSLQDFLNQPIELTDAHPENRDDYLGWSIAYKKDQAYDRLVDQNPELLTNPKKVIKAFLIAARVGNAHAFNSLKAVLRALKPAGYTFIFLKALDLIMKLQPELLYLAHQVLTEDIAPAKVKSLK